MQLLELYQLIELINASHLLSIMITLFLVPISCNKGRDNIFLRWEPELQLFEVYDNGDDGGDDLSHHQLPNFKQL